MDMTKQRKRLLIIFSIPLVLLLLPLVAMQFTAEVNWTVLDFVIAGFLLLGTGLFIEIAIRKVQEKKLQLILIFSAIIFLVLLWIELAVGIFGTPLAGS